MQAMHLHTFFIRKLVMLLVLDFLKTYLNFRVLFFYFDGEEGNSIKD